MTSRVYENRPNWKFQVRPSFEAVSHCLIDRFAAAEAGPLWLDFDIETRGGHIDCIGFSWSRTEGICIPLMTRANLQGYWSADEEAKIVFSLYKLLTHPNVRVRWQNGLYDAQYVYRHWHFIPRGVQDTMISQHSVFAALPKGLSFLASMYADWYVYWKDEGKIASDIPEEQRWTYNLQDCVYTREAGEVLTQTLEVMKLSAVDATQQELFYPVLTAMLRGVRIRTKVKEEMAVAIQDELSHRQAFLFNILGHEINPRSSKQMQTLFYEDLRQPIIYKRGMLQGRVHVAPTCDDEALTKIAAREPLLRPICHAIADIRTLEKFHHDFVMMPLDEDGRMRCSFNIAGDAGGKSAPYSYRLSSSKNPFGSGGNLQTIPSEKSKSSGKAAARGSMDFTLPNIRSMYGPDPGFTFFDMDLDRADLQVVVWESGEKDWMAAMRLGVDMHLANAFLLDHVEPPPMEELVETHPKYPDHRGPRKHSREFAKVFCHATNYGGGAKTVAAHTGKTVQEIDRAQKYWFGAHAGIRQWHDRTFAQINRFRFVENRWGYRWYIFDRLEALLPEALAWVPQSTVGILINKIWIAFYKQLPEVQVLLQVHDSLAGQFPSHRREALLPRMLAASRISIPYEDPLIIPTGVKTSDVSWGDCA
jgi:DNA polymerase I-like protein with 3'-5' exonuclease and polymerase domains